MSADRRTMAVAAVAMVALIAVGVVSAAVFTRSACEALVAEPAASRAGGSDVEAVLATEFGDLEPAGVAATAEALAMVAGSDAGLVGAAGVGDAEALTTLEDRLAAVGDEVTRLEAPAAAGPAVTLAGDATVVGDGGTLFALAMVNDLTGQVDAIAPVDGELEAGDCLDTAQVGVPLTFHLDAGDGQLLLLRVDEDAERPELELRDATGSVWSQRLQLGAGPPGVLAERLAGHLDDDVVVTGRRALPDEDAPVVEARDRDDGELRWSLAPQDVDQLAPGGQDAILPTVLDVADSRVLLAVGREERDRRLVVALDARDGRPLWTSDLVTEGPPHVVADGEGSLLMLAPRMADGATARHELVELDLDEGGIRLLHAVDTSRVLAAQAGGRVLLAVDDGVARLDDEKVRATLPDGVEVVDLRTVDGGVALLLRRDDAGVVVWARMRDAAA